MSMETLERVAEFFNVPEAEVVQLFTKAEVRAIKRERQEFRRRRFEDFDALLAELARHAAHAQFEADYAEITAFPLTADEVGTVLASVPGDTSVVVAFARGAA